MNIYNMNTIDYDNEKKFNIEVSVRIKPCKAIQNIDVNSSDNTVTLKSTDISKKFDLFKFTKVFDQESNQNDIFETIGEQVVRDVYNGYNSCIFAYGQTGCFGRNTRITMYDNKQVFVQDIKIGDIILGDDNSPRKVLQLYRGYQQLYKISVNEFYDFPMYVHDEIFYENFIVNEDHILLFVDKSDIITTKCSSSINDDSPVLHTYNKYQMLELTVAEYIYHQQKDNLYCATTYVSYRYNKSYDIPYHVDDSILSKAIPYTGDSIYKLELDPYLFGLTVREFFKHSFYLIPSKYKYNTYNVRYNLLCGLIGSTTLPCKFDLPYSSYMNKQIVTIIRSLGYNVVRRANKYNLLSSYFKPNVVFNKYGAYYGFNIDGNNRFIGEGFNVLRNSGKSYTMMGESNNIGLIPRICNELLEKDITKCELPIDRNETETQFKLYMSYYEIYLEKIRDLLSDNNKNLLVREDPINGPYVENLSSHELNNSDDMHRLIEQGNIKRATATTAMNNQSSRSHAIICLDFKQIITKLNELPMNIFSKLYLVDLAGNENIKNSQVTGINLAESKNINLSLLTLGIVIDRLSKQRNSSTLRRVPSNVSNNSNYSNYSTNSNNSNTSKHIPRKIIVKSTNIYSDANNSNKFKTNQTNLPSPVFNKTKINDPIPFRDSVLTWILKNIFSGNSKTRMISMINPLPEYYHETLNTLRYSCLASSIVNNIKVNKQRDELINGLKSEIDLLRQKLSSKPIENTPSQSIDSKLQIETLFESNKKFMEYFNEKIKDYETKYFIDLERNIKMYEDKLNFEKNDLYEKYKLKLDENNKQHIMEIEKLNKLNNEKIEQLNKHINTLECTIKELNSTKFTLIKQVQQLHTKLYNIDNQKDNQNLN